MFKEERKETIIELLKKRKFASVRELCSVLFASEPTIRRDLTVLEREGLIRRSHGGAMLVEDELFRPLGFRKNSMQPEKRAIAQKAVELISEGAVLFVDASTTALNLIPLLQGRKVTVISNGLAALSLMQELKVPAKCTGGDLLTDSMCFVGRAAEQYIAALRADILFYSVSCLNEMGEITDYSEEETYLRREMLRCARKKVLLLDSSKYGKTATFPVATIEETDYVISGMSCPKALKGRCNWICVDDEKVKV